MVAKAAFASLALVISVTAGPVTQGLGSQISFSIRRSLVDGEGWFDHDKALQQVVRDHNKHRNNLMNLEKNLGQEAFNEGAEVKPFMHHSPIQKRQAEPLRDESQDEYWAGNMDIGTPPKTFYMDFDTGSADLWVPSVNCTSSVCAKKQKYAADASSSEIYNPNSKFLIRYGDGSSVSGPVFQDTVAVAGLKVSNQYFSPASVVSESFATERIDGIIGLAYQTLSNIHQPPFVNNAKQQGVIKTAVFGFKLAASGSELYLGGTDSSLYTGQIEYHPVVGRTGYWQIGGGKLSLGSSTIASDLVTIIDSGTTLIYGPPAMVAALYSHIPDSAVYDSKAGFYSMPCQSIPSNVGFSWGGRTWNISAANFNAGRVSLTTCIGAIAAQDLGLGKNVWLVGDSFMKNVYSAFSFDQNSVGFAPLK